MIDVKNQHLSYDGGFPRVDNALYRLYPLLVDMGKDGSGKPIPDFTLETTAVYGYLRTWEQNNKDHKLYGYSWLTMAEMEALTGMSYHLIRKHINTLKRYDLVEEKKSEMVRNKSIFQTLEPLTEAEFRAKYPDVIDKLKLRLDAVEEKLKKDRQRRRSAG